jgi:uncharacterized protein involved in exopolysaccharide biosynthesis
MLIDIENTDNEDSLKQSLKLYSSYLDRIKELQQDQNILYTNIARVLEQLKEDPELSKNNKAIIAKLITKSLLE